MGIGILKGLLSNRLMRSSCGDESSVDSDVNLVPVVPDPEELLMFPNGFLPKIHTFRGCRSFLRHMNQDLN